MKRFWFRLSGYVGLSLIALAIAGGPVSAIDSCKIKVDKKTGVIYFSAKNLSPAASDGTPGFLQWKVGATADYGYEFFDPACRNTGTLKATKCTLGDPAGLQSKTPPSDCTLYVEDNGDLTSCSVWIPGCQPAARGRGAIAYMWMNQPSGPLNTTVNPDPRWSYNAAGQTNGVMRLATGYYEVTFPGVRSNAVPHNNVQITPWGSTNRCQIYNWGFGDEVTVTVQCQNAAGVAADTYFSILVIE